MKSVFQSCFCFAALFLGLFTVAKGQPSANDSLIVLPVGVFNSQTTVSIPISLANSVPVSGIAGRMVFDANILSPVTDSQSGLISFERVERGLALSWTGASSPNPGVLTFLLVRSLENNEIISPGRGPVCRLYFNVLTPQDTTVCIRLEDNPDDPSDVKNQLSDEEGLVAIFPTLKSGTLLVGAGNADGACLQSAFKLGDLNLDDRLSLADLVLELNCTYLTATWDCPLYLADINCDGTLTVADGMSIMNAAFLLEPLPVCSP